MLDQFFRYVTCYKSSLLMLLALKRAVGVWFTVADPLFSDLEILYTRLDHLGMPGGWPYKHTEVSPSYFLCQDSHESILRKTCMQHCATFHSFHMPVDKLHPSCKGVLCGPSASRTSRNGRTRDGHICTWTPQVFQTDQSACRQSWWNHNPGSKSHRRHSQQTAQDNISHSYTSHCGWACNAELDLFLLSLCLGQQLSLSPLLVNQPMNHLNLSLNSPYQM